jgi:ComF family protein
MIFNQTTHCRLCTGHTNSSSLICQSCWNDLTSDHAVCKKCGRRLTATRLCAQCMGKPGFVDNTLTLTSYNFPVTTLLRSLKYKNQLSLAREFGEKLADKILSENISLPDRLIPVPLHPRRLFFRGYNQSLEIARTISSRIAVPLEYKSCKRVRNTLPQFDLKPAERRTNIKGAFSLYGSELSGSIAIVDDIVTTGQTANELAKVLKAAGATKVSLWACAHADN